MTVLLVAAALVAGTGAIAALAPLDGRLGIVGLAASLIAAALIADPLPGPAVLAVRLAAALLVVVILRAAAVGAAASGRGDGRGDPRGWSGHLADSQLGWPAEILLGLAGAAAGAAIALTVGAVTTSGGDVGQAATVGPVELFGAETLGLGAAGLIVAIGLGPLLGDASLLRRATAAVLVTEAVVLARGALVPASSALEDVILAALLVVVAGSGAALVLASASGRIRVPAPERPATQRP